MWFLRCNIVAKHLRIAVLYIKTVVKSKQVGSTINHQHGLKKTETMLKVLMLKALQNEIFKNTLLDSNS